MTKQQKMNYRNDPMYNVQLMRAVEQTLVLAAIRRNELTESEILRSAPVFVKWKAGLVLNEGEYCVHEKDENGYHKVYLIGTSHKSQDIWYPGKPDDAESARRYELKGYVNGVRIWVKPTGNVDAPDTDDIVHHNGSNWSSTEDNNLYEPTDGNPFWTKL